jgi:16S rRNA (cytosine967-C5)-methyltransferase
MKKPLKQKDNDVLALILLGFYQLFYMRVPDHAAINETVGATRKPWAKSLINAVLRNCQRRYPDFPEGFACSEAELRSHPQWLYDQIKTDWPEQVDELVMANNERAPMTLRVNRQLSSRDAYIDTLLKAGIDASPGKLSDTSVTLKAPVPVSALPGFDEGMVSVQDEASQCIPPLLDLHAGMSVLDACAAPGGKTLAMLETQPALKVTAVDPEERRLERMLENLSRCGQRDNVEIRCGDSTDTSFLESLGNFDRILVDAPCSATGVIRRHPDIKVLRTVQQVEALIEKQALLLDRLWPLVKKNGMLLYTTCSVLKAENSEQIVRFLERTPDANSADIDIGCGEGSGTGLQLFTGSHGQDGFYYALLQKC